jgi:endonuclease/exonuclease/phosphatase family metal-dependent hydrolase
MSFPPPPARKKRTALALALLVAIPAAWYAQSRLFAPLRAVHYARDPAIADAGAKQSLAVATYNIAHGRGGRFGASNWTGASRDEVLDHLQALADHIASAAPDIVVLNEADIDATWSQRINQPLYIAERAGFGHVLLQRNMDVAFPFRTYRFGNAILSKYPLSGFRFLDFPALSRREQLLAGDHDGVACVAATPLGPVLVVAVHLEYRSEAVRARAALQIAGLVVSNGLPAIVAGDFNSAPAGFPKHDTAGGTNAMDVLLASGLVTLLPEDRDASVMTFPSSAPDRIIDWILTTPDLVQAHRRVHASPLSDHQMVSAEITSAPVAR